MRWMRPARGRGRARGEAVAGIDEPVAIVGMGAQGDGERALVACRVAMAGKSEQVTQERKKKKWFNETQSILTVQNSKFHIET